MSKKYLIPLAVLISLVLVGIWIYRTLNWRNIAWARAAEELPAQLELARKEGLPLELADIGLPMKVPPHENAALLYKEAFVAVQALKPFNFRNKLQYDLHDASVDPLPFKAAVRKSRQRLQAVFKPLGTVLQKPGCDFERDWSAGFNTLFPELADAKDVVKYLSYDAVLDAKEGDLDEALRKLEIAARIGHDVGREPTLIGALVQLAIDAIVGRFTERIISMSAESDGDLAKIERTLNRFAASADLKRGIRGEIVIGRIGIRNLRSIRELTGGDSDFSMGSSQPPPTGNFLTDLVAPDDGKPKYGNPPPETLRKGMEARYLEFCRKAYPYLMNSKTSKDSPELDALVARYEASKDPSYMAASMLMPYSGMGNPLARGDAVRLMNRVKVKVLRHRLRTGMYPLSLADLGPVPLDPFDGNPLRYRLLERSGGKRKTPGSYPVEIADAGFIIYSVGMNGMDDGGIAPGEATGRSMMDSDQVVEHPIDPVKIKRAVRR